MGDKPLSLITEDDIEAVFTDLRHKGRATSTRNGYVQVLKASFRWAAKKEYIAKSPISDSEIVRRGKVAQRNRRLAPDVVDKNGKLTKAGEERRLIDVASPALQRLIIGALDTACRRGELLALRWADIDLPGRELRIRAETAKDGEQRLLPISDRLAAILEMAKIDPAGEEYKSTDYVFGEVGQQLTTIKKTWETAVLKAHGHTPIWKKGSLSEASRAALRRSVGRVRSVRAGGGRAGPFSARAGRYFRRNTVGAATRSPRATSDGMSRTSRAAVIEAVNR